MASPELSPATDRGSSARVPESAGGRRAYRPRSSGYLGSLWIIGPLMPGLAAAVTIAAYLFLPTRPGSDPAAPNDPAVSIAAGLIVTSLVWAIGAYVARPLVSAPRAQVRLYSDLLERSRSLRDRLSAVDTRTDEARASAEEARTHLDYVHEELEGDGKGPALGWALASGYINVLRGLHRADEALVAIESSDAAVGDALHDALSLEGSTIGNAKRLIGILSVGVDRLSPASAAVFLPPDADRSAAADKALSDREAREALREVRHAVNEYRDDRHDGLVRARNRLVWTMLAVGVTTYLLLSMALVADVGVRYVQAVAVLYLVGAIVGLFNRLRIDAGQSSAVEDFGLSQARLVVTPLVSGLAALGGVYLVAMAPALLPTGTTGAADAPQLNQVFDLVKNPIGLVYAAIFGLTPGALTSRLTAASARLQRDLQSTEAAASAPPASDQGVQ